MRAITDIQQPAKAKFPIQRELIIRILEREIAYSFIARALSTTKTHLWSVLHGYASSKALCARIDEFLKDYDRLMGITPDGEG